MKERLQGLDVFRGATVALMILVNNPGDWSKTYAPLLHAEWHGCTPTDLVFPFFLFIVGVAIPFALPKDPAAAAPHAKPAHRKILRRAATLFALGLFLNFFPFYTVVLERVRFPGVLQRIAVVYLCAALAWVHLGPKARAALAALLLGGYWAAMKLVTVPGFGAGDLSPQGNLAFHLDHLLLGAHTWRYSPGPGDPEGILSTLPAIATALFGIFCGGLLWRVLPPPAAPLPAKLGRMAAAGALLTIAGLLLSPLFPLNKNLWSPTYVLFTGGLALLCLGATLLLVDHLKIEAWSRPFAIFGRNAILAFVGSGLLAKLLLVVFRWQEGEQKVTLQGWLYHHLYVPIFPEYVASLAWALCHVLFWLALLSVLDRLGIRLKV